MKKRTLCLIIIAIILACTLAISLYYVSYTPYKLISRQAYGMNLTVEDSGVIGFDVSNEQVAFGTVPKGGFARRHIVLENNNSFDVQVYINAMGDLSEWVIVSHNNFTMGPMGVREVNVTANVPENAPAGNYTGNLTFSFYRLQ